MLPFAVPAMITVMFKALFRRTLTDRAGPDIHPVRNVSGAECSGKAAGHPAGSAAETRIPGPRNQSNARDGLNNPSRRGFKVLFPRTLTALALAGAAALPARAEEDPQDAWNRNQSECSLALSEERYPAAAAACGVAAALAEHLESGLYFDASLNDLALAYLHQGKYREGEEIVRRILTLRTKNFGADHPMTAGTLALLAAIYRKTNRAEAAKPLDADVARILGTCEGQQSEETREQIAETPSSNPCNPAPIPYFMQ